MKKRYDGLKIVSSEIIRQVEVKTIIWRGTGVGWKKDCLKYELVVPLITPIVISRCEGIKIPLKHNKSTIRLFWITVTKLISSSLRRRRFLFNMNEEAVWSDANAHFWDVLFSTQFANAQKQLVYLRKKKWSCASILGTILFSLKGTRKKKNGSRSTSKSCDNAIMSIKSCAVSENRRIYLRGSILE